MYQPNNREELKAMQGILPFNAFRVNRKMTKSSVVIESSTEKRTVVWMDALKNNPMLPVDTAFLVRLYRCT